MKYGILIPAYQPDKQLENLAEKLSEYGFETIVVNDGSTVGLDILDAVSKISHVKIIGYEKNEGKGHALKTGLEYMAKNGFDAAITADADGQHTPEDIKKIAKELEKHPGALITGMRSVSEMPARSKTGNSITRFFFKMLYGIKMRDTQTGLRGIPLTKENLKGLLSLKGERYEYEMEMLIMSDTLFPEGIIEVPIETVYIGGNESSHFRPLKDGAKIYAVLLRSFPKFLLSSFSSAVIDYICFNILFYFVLDGLIAQSAVRMVPSVLLARLVSASYCYIVNKFFVFKTEESRFTPLNYFKLAVTLLALNLTLMELLTSLLHMKAFLAKVLVEVTLHLGSFSVQQKWAVKKK